MRGCCSAGWMPGPRIVLHFAIYHGGDMASTWVAKPEVHAERVVTLVKKSLQLDIVANDENYALAA